MLKFIKITLFVIVLLFCLGMINYLYSYFDNHRIDNYVNNLKNVPEHIVYLIVGDSHGYKDIDNRILNKLSYNLSQLSDSLLDIYSKLLFLIDNDVKIDNIIIPLDPHLFANYRIFRNNNEIIIKYLDYNSYTKINNVNYLEFYLLKIPVFSQKNRNFVFKSSVKKIIHLFSNTSKDTIKENIIFSIKDQSISEKNINSVKRSNYHFSNGILDKDKIKDVFIKIVRLAKKNNIELIGIKYPVSKYYYENASEKYNHYIESINNFTKNHIDSILDYEKLFYHKDEYFQDMDHLNIKGAIEFTKILNQHLK